MLTREQYAAICKWEEEHLDMDWAVCIRHMLPLYGISRRLRDNPIRIEQGFSWAPPHGEPC